MSGSTSASTNTDYEDRKCDKKIIKTISNIISEIVEENKFLNFSKENLDLQKKLSFFSKIPASVTIHKYIERIVKYTHVEESTFILALIYIDRICEYNDIILTDGNIHRILFSSIIMAIKINEDDYYSNNYYSKVGGISVKELNGLEYDFVRLIRYNLFVNQEIYEKYKIFISCYKNKM